MHDLFHDTFLVLSVENRFRRDILDRIAHDARDDRTRGRCSVLLLRHSQHGARGGLFVVPTAQR